jgi:phosphonopyruvate decarboxylase
MIDPADALRVLTASGIGFYAGVPDSLLKDLNACIADNVEGSHHVVAHNEGGAIALAAGHFLATGRPGLVYMQNSGLGNAVNPLVSLASPEVYGIPIVLMIGWRGQPGRSDEPQHSHQGRVTEEMLETLGVPVRHLSGKSADWEDVISGAVAAAQQTMSSVALLVSAGTFAPYVSKTPGASTGRPRRIDVLSTILDSLPPDTCYVATTGYTARELAALRLERGESDARDFLGVGSMGHAGAIALGLALARPDLGVICLDGDGSLGMHMGIMALIGDRRPSNLGHVLFNNRVHESVGGQPSVLRSVDVVNVASACGYSSSASCARIDDVQPLLGRAVDSGGPWFIEIEISSGTIGDLARPDGFDARLARMRQSLRS